MKRSSPQVQSRRYRSALALNNIAVRLLERSCYAQAKEALEAALPLMKTVVVAEPSTKPNKKHGQDLPFFLDLNNGGETLVQEAMRHLAEPKPNGKAAMLIEVLTVTPDGSLVSGELPAADDLHPSSTCLKSILESTPCSYTALPIRIEENLLQEDPSLLLNSSSSASTASLKMALSQQVAMLSHNLAIACLCQSKTCKSSRETRTLRKMALFHSHNAYSVLLKQGAAVAALSVNNTTEDADCCFQTSSSSSRLSLLPCVLIAILSFKVSKNHHIMPRLAGFMPN